MLKKYKGARENVRPKALLKRISFRKRWVANGRLVNDLNASQVQYTAFNEMLPEK